MNDQLESVLQRIQDWAGDGGEVAVRSLVHELHHAEDMTVRGEAARALGTLAAPEARIALIVALRNESRHARLSAAEALGRARERRAVSGLVELLKDRDRPVRLRAIEALGRIGDPAALAPLTSQLSDPNASVRMLAAEALGRLGDERAIGALVGTMVDGNTMVRRPAVEAMARIGGDAALEPLMGSLEDKAWEIQVNSARALARIGGRQVTGALMGWCQRVLSSEARKLSFEQKLELVHEVLSQYARAADTEALQALSARLPAEVRVRHWIDEAGPEGGEWAWKTRRHPVADIVHEELDRRGASSPAPEPEAHPRHEPPPPPEATAPREADKTSSEARRRAGASEAIRALDLDDGGSPRPRPSASPPSASLAVRPRTPPSGIPARRPATPSGGVRRSEASPSPISESGTGSGLSPSRNEILRAFEEAPASGRSSAPEAPKSGGDEAEAAMLDALRVLERMRGGRGGAKESSPTQPPLERTPPPGSLGRAAAAATPLPVRPAPASAGETESPAPSPPPEGAVGEPPDGTVSRLDAALPTAGAASSSASESSFLPTGSLPANDLAATMVFGRAASGAAPEAVEAAPEEFPAVGPVVSAFLDFLRRKDLSGVVLLGGAIRDGILGRTPADLDVTVKVDVWEEVDMLPSDPVAWNLQYVSQVDEALHRLADALDTTPQSLVRGRAVFDSPAGPLPIHYVGPFVVEEETLEFQDDRAVQVLRRTVSRAGLVVDRLSEEVRGLAATSRVGRMWLDMSGHPSAEALRGARDLAASRLDFEAPTGRGGARDLLRVLYEAFLLGTELSPATAAMLERSRPGDTPLAAQTAQLEFSPELFSRIVEIAGIEPALEGLDALGLLAAVRTRLEGAARDSAEAMLRDRESLRRTRAREAEDALAAAQAEVESRLAELDRLRQSLQERADELDAIRSATSEMEATMRGRIEALSVADRAARAAGERLDAATRGFGGIAKSGTMDVSLLEEHRAALAAKREADVTFANLKREVEGLRAELEKRQNEGIGVQEKIESLGASMGEAFAALEPARIALEEVEARVARANDESGASDLAEAIAKVRAERSS